MSRAGAWLKRNSAVLYFAIVPAMIVFLILRQNADRVKAIKDSTTRQNSIKAVAQTAADSARDAKASADRSDASLALLKDCVGLTPGGDCLKRLGEVRAKADEDSRTKLVAALRAEFGILQGRLIIRVETDESGHQVISVGSQSPGQVPGKQAPLPPGQPAPSPTTKPGTTVQECVVELHAEPLIGACAVPR